MAVNVSLYKIIPIQLNTLQAKVLFRVESKTLPPDRVGMKISHLFLHFYVNIMNLEILVTGNGYLALVKCNVLVIRYATGYFCFPCFLPMKVTV